jgi:hypothetical protein
MNSQDSSNPDPDMPPMSAQTCLTLSSACMLLSLAGTIIFAGHGILPVAFLPVLLILSPPANEPMLAFLLLLLAALAVLPAVPIMMPSRVTIKRAMLPIQLLATCGVFAWCFVGAENDGVFFSLGYLLMPISLVAAILGYVRR